MKKLLIALLLLSGCNRGADSGNGSAAAEGGAGKRAGVQAGASEPAERAGLTGLWEGGAGPQKNQLCMIGKGDKASFGLAVWGAGSTSCLGAGDATRSGERITLKMAGDETCAIEATIEGERITLPAAMPAGCGYYCASGVKMAGVSLSRSEAGSAAALRARDIAGDPLCEGAN